MNPFEDAEPSIYIVDLIVEYEVKHGTIKWHRNIYKKNRTEFNRRPVYLMNGEFPSKEYEKQLIDKLLSEIGFKTIADKTKIVELKNIKFSSKIAYEYKKH